MAGHGPAPKQPATRARRNQPARGEWQVLSVFPYRGPKPDLRGLPLEGRLSPNSKRAWDGWWSSPMAHMWTQAEWPKLIRLLVVTEFVYRATKRGDIRTLSSLIKETRYLEDGLGISEKGRRDLRWQLPIEDDQPALAVVTDLSSRRRPDPRSKK